MIVIIPAFFHQGTLATHCLVSRGKVSTKGKRCIVKPFITGSDLGLVIWGPFYWHGLNSIPARISNFRTRPTVKKISPWIKSTSNELDITFHVIASQLSGHCGAISNRLWRHQHNVIRTRHCDDMWRLSFQRHLWISCVVQEWNNVCTLVTNCLCVHSSVIWGLDK